MKLPVEIEGHGRFDLGLFLADDIDTLGGPFSDSNYTYFSDGRLMIRIASVPKFENSPPYALDHLPLKPAPGQVGGWCAIPDYDLPAPVNCHTCLGSGKTSICEECNGDGDVHLSTCQNDYAWECKSCEGGGKLAGGNDQCTDCDGTGKAYHKIPPNITVAGTRLNLLLLEKLKTLPGVELFLPQTKKGFVLIRFAFGVGLLAAMSKA